MHELAVCTVRSASGAEAVGFVREAGEGWLAVAMNDEAIVDESWKPDLDVIIVVLDDVRGECSYRGVTVEVGSDVIVVALHALLGIEQKRSAARVRVSLPCHGQLTVPYGAGLSGDADDTAAGEPPSRELRFTLLDISATGMRFMAPVPVPVDALVTFRLPIPGASVHLRARVVRSTESRSGWHHGAQFEHLLNSESDLLYRYVMREQGAQRRRQVFA